MPHCLAGMTQGSAGWRTAACHCGLSASRQARSVRCRKPGHWAQQTGHAGSIAHAYINEAMLNCYRRDFSALRSVIADLRQLTERHHMPSLAAAAQIFEGWCDGNAGQVESGRDKMRQGLGLHGEFQTPEDEPVYCGMLAELLTRTGEIDEALALLGSAAAQAEGGGSRYWLAELHRRRAELLLAQGAAEAEADHRPRKKPCHRRGAERGADPHRRIRGTCLVRASRRSCRSAIATGSNARNPLSSRALR